MTLLSIETSCDETAVAVLTFSRDGAGVSYQVRGDALLSQIDLHREFGGVFPALAKREHTRTIVPLLAKALEDAGLLAKGSGTTLDESLFAHEPELVEPLRTFLVEHAAPQLDGIAVTHGPGLAPALWVGVNVARALSRAWGVPLVPVNHMEGHIVSALAKDGRIENPKLPLLSLLISGGHTELVLSRSLLSYELIGRTRDDAVGEAFDKAARMMGLPYPGGPEIGRLAKAARDEAIAAPLPLPRPMLASPDCDFSFAGLKTAVLYALRDTEPTETFKKGLAREFEDAVGEVLWKKTERALEETDAQTLAIGGGVSASPHLQALFREKIAERGGVDLRIPARSLATDNAVMIGLAGFFRLESGGVAENIAADGNLRLAGKPAVC